MPGSPGAQRSCSPLARSPSHGAAPSTGAGWPAKLADTPDMRRMSEDSACHASSGESPCVHREVRGGADTGECAGKRTGSLRRLVVLAL